MDSNGTLTTTGNPHATKEQVGTRTKPAHLLPLAQWAENVYHGLAAQDDDEVFNMVFDRSFSRKVTAYDAAVNETFDFDSLKAFIRSGRASTPGRTLISMEGIIQPGQADAEGGGVCVLAKLRVPADGKEQVFTAVHNFFVVFDKETGRRQCINFSGLSGMSVDRKRG